MRPSEVKAAAIILQWAERGDKVAWVPEDGTEIIYGELHVSPEQLNQDVADVRLELRTNRSFSLQIYLGHAIYKYENELLMQYDWTQTRLRELKGAS